MLCTFTKKRLICLAIIVCYFVLSNVSQASSLSMMLNQNNFETVAIADKTMPCHQVEQDATDNTFCKDCINCHFCMIAGTQLINLTNSTTSFSHVSEIYQLTESVNSDSQNYPPAIRPPIS